MVHPQSCMLVAYLMSLGVVVILEAVDSKGMELINRQYLLLGGKMGKAVCVTLHEIKDQLLAHRSGEWNTMHFPQGNFPIDATPPDQVCTSVLTIMWCSCQEVNRMRQDSPLNPLLAHWCGLLTAI